MSKIFSNSRKLNKDGFTLLELLVVIAIIGILAGVTFMLTNQARMKTRDSKRASDVKEIQNAIELYYTDHGHYPLFGIDNGMRPRTATNYAGTPVEEIAQPQTDLWIELQTELAPYISKLPDAPRLSADPNIISYSYVVGYPDGWCWENRREWKDGYVVFAMTEGTLPDEGGFLTAMSGYDVYDVWGGDYDDTNARGLCSP